MLNDLLNVLLGVIASLIGWLILTKALRPRISFGDSIEHVIRKDSSEYYRLAYKNPRIRRVEDVNVSARLFRRVSVGPDGRRAWESSDIPLDEPFRPVLGRLPLATRIRRHIGGQRRLIQHVTLQVERLEGSRFLANLPDDCPPIVHLHDFLQKTDATIEFTIRAADGYSGTYRTVARTYKAQHVSIIDRRAQQIADIAHENGNEDANLPSLTVTRRIRLYLSNASRAMVFRTMEWLRLQPTTGTRKRDNGSTVTVDTDDQGRQ